MGIETIVSPPTRYRGPEGSTLPINGDLPFMRSRKDISDRKAVELLDEAMADLVRLPCPFWACDGPRRPRPMITCCKCQAIRQLMTLRETLAQRAHLPLASQLLRINRDGTRSDGDILVHSHDEPDAAKDRTWQSR